MPLRMLMASPPPPRLRLGVVAPLANPPRSLPVLLPEMADKLEKVPREPSGKETVWISIWEMAVVGSGRVRSVDTFRRGGSFGGGGDGDGDLLGLFVVVAVAIFLLTVFSVGCDSVEAVVLLLSLWWLLSGPGAAVMSSRPMMLRPKF
jgi:hypothetical protein